MLRAGAGPAAHLVEGERGLLDEGHLAGDLQRGCAARVHDGHQLIGAHLIVQPPPHCQLHLPEHLLRVAKIQNDR